MDLLVLGASLTILFFSLKKDCLLVSKYYEVDCVIQGVARGTRGFSLQHSQQWNIAEIKNNPPVVNTVVLSTQRYLSR